MFDLATIQRMNNAAAKARLKFANSERRKRQKLVLPSGLTHCEGLDGKRICTGTQMGRPDRLPLVTAGACLKLRLQRLPFVDGCYDRWGAYWGAPATVWCAWSGEDVRVFVRADSREIAKAKVKTLVPAAKFFR
jgi:hypothetical protein